MPATAKMSVVIVSERCRLSARVSCGATTKESRMMAAAAPIVRALDSFARSCGS
jgi:hypothetical protein